MMEKSCCVCIRKLSKNYHKIKDPYNKNKKFHNESMTIFDVLEKLGLLNYEIKNVDKTIICGYCKKMTFNFYDFKIMTENTQKSSHLPIKAVPPDEQSVDRIEKYLKPDDYKCLKNYISKTKIDSIEKNDENELIIRPYRREKETILMDTSFIDPAMIKVEFEEPETIFKIEVLDLEYENNFDEKEVKSEEDERESEDEFFETEEQAESDLAKIVVNNIQFISRKTNSLDYTPNLSTSNKPPGKNSRHYRRIEASKARASGKSYISSGGKIIKAKKLQPSCDNCTYGCTKRLTYDDRRKNFQNYWNLADFALQKKFIFEHRQTFPVKKKQSDGNPMTRKFISSYFLDKFTKKGKFKCQEKVCEIMFCRTLNIHKNAITTLNKQAVTGKVQDMRGQGRRKPAPGYLFAIDYVKEFPHFYIEQKLTVKEVYQSYIQLCKEKEVSHVSRSTFYAIFSKNNETDFLKNSHREKCETCVKHEQLSEEQQAAMQIEYDAHLKVSKKCYNRVRWRRNGKARFKRIRELKQQAALENEQQEKSEETDFLNL